MGYIGTSPQSLSTGQINMGIGLLGDPNLIIKRKNRWTMQIVPECGLTTTANASTAIGSGIPEFFIKSAGRPNLSIESLELNFLNEKYFIPGKATWETITVTFIDVAGASLVPLYSWLCSVYDFSNNSSSQSNGFRWQSSSPATYAATVFLNEYSGCGDLLSYWTMLACYPEAMNFGEVSMDSNEEMTIELTLRYNQATWWNSCGPQPQPCGCLPCGTPLGQSSFASPNTNVVPS